MRLTIDHVGIEVRENMLDLSAMFFTDIFDWEECRESLSKSWGFARFVREQGSNVIIQLTDVTPPIKKVNDLVVGHIAFTVDDTSKSRKLISKWCVENNLVVEYTEVSNGKVFVTIPGLFVSSFELIPK